MLPSVGYSHQLVPRPTCSVRYRNAIACVLLILGITLFSTSCSLPAQSNVASATQQSDTKTTSSDSASGNPVHSGDQLTVSGTMPTATVGSPFSALVSASGGKAPYNYALIWQILPPGLTLNASTGQIFGIPTASGSYLFSVSATDLPRHGYGDHRFTIQVDGQSGGGGGGVTVTISPSTVILQSGATQQFTATVTGSSQAGVTWSATAGTISSSGFFTAPQVQTATTVSVTAVSVADPTASASATVDLNPVNPPPPPPTGADNRYCGAGDVPNFGGNDGPAQMPQSCNYTALDGTPTPGKITTVAAGGDVQGALNAASCGDTIELQAGATYDYSNAGLKFPVKSCDDQHWIIVRTSTPDAQLPPEGSRLTPCWAGVTSLSGRPAYACPANGAADLTAKILVSANTTLSFSGASHYRLIGLEITRPSGTGVTYNLVTTGGGSKLIFDRMWIHGDALDETTRGVALSNASQVSVIDSYLSDFHCNAITGVCVDSQAINGGCNTGSSSTFKIVDNFLEAASENIIFGGCASTQTTTDIEIRRNHSFKPTTWDPNDPGYIGTAFEVKNNFELKDAERVLFEGNLLENTWGGYSQPGFSILITAKNQSGTDPGAHIANVTLRYSQAAHAGGAVDIGAGLSDSGNSSLGIWNISVHDMIFDDVSNTCFECNGNAIQITRGDPNAVAHDVVIDHITVPRTTNLNGLFIAGSESPAWQNVTVSNSIMAVGTYQLTGTGAGSSDCSKGWTPQNPTTAMANCWSPYTVTSNVMLNGFGTWPASNWMSTPAAVQFNNYNNGDGGDYQLLGSSPYKNGASDGKDIGADVATINTQLLGVQ